MAYTQASSGLIPVKPGEIVTSPSSPIEPPWSPLSTSDPPATLTALIDNTDFLTANTFPSFDTNITANDLPSLDELDPLASETTTSSDELRPSLSSNTTTSPAKGSPAPQIPSWACLNDAVFAVSRHAESSDRTSPPPDIPTWANLKNDDLPSSMRDTQVHIPKYDFRLGPRDPNRVAPTTWVDQDATGTYDPNASYDPYIKTPVNCILRAKRPRPERPFNYAEYQAKRSRLVTWQRGRLEGKRLVSILTFTSEPSKATLIAYGAKLDNWPGAAFTLPSGEPDWDAWWNSHAPVPESEFLYSDTYDLRDRSALALLRKDTDDKDEFEEITLGHPAARGCKGCIRLGLHCPLLGEGAIYPCSFCIEENISCDLILEPPVKARCTRCTQRKIVCPFTKDDNQRGPCRPCQDAGVSCIAGPKSGRTRIGPCLDAPYTAGAIEKAKRSAATCIQCREGDNWCSLKGRRETPPCKQCFNNGVGCTFESRETQAVMCRRKTASHPIEGKPVGATSIFSLKKHKFSHKSSLKTITTKLAHPVKFNYQPVNDESGPACHWCDDSLYGLLGLGEVEVEVIDDKEGKGYTEITGGHTAAGYIPSRMCDMCTLERLIIAACRVHELEPIADMDPETFVFDSVFEYMMPGMAASTPFQWCSVCPAPAFFQCAKKSDVDMDVGEDGEGTAVSTGCGLRLCEFCAVTLVGEHDRDLAGLIDSMKATRAGDGFGLRADVDMLHPRGELMKRMEKL